MNRNAVLHIGACERLELTSWATARPILACGRDFSFHLSSWEPFRATSCFLNQFLWTFSNVRTYSETEHTTIRGQDQSLSSGLFVSYNVPSYPVGGENSRYKKPMCNADHSPSFSLWFRITGSLCSHLMAPSLARCLGKVTTAADTCFMCQVPATQSQLLVTFKLRIFIQM